MMEALADLFSFVCGQHPGHIWAPGGVELPLCQRCTGLYCGALWGLVWLLLLRPTVTTRFLWAHGVLLLQMAPAGFHWVKQGPVLRTLSGALFAFGLVAFLGLLPLERRPGQSRPKEGAAATYWLALAAGLGILLGLALWGGKVVGVLLSICAVVGALCLTGLAVWNVVLLGSLRSPRVAHWDHEPGGPAVCSVGFSPCGKRVRQDAARPDRLKAGLQTAAHALGAVRSAGFSPSGGPVGQEPARHGGLTYRAEAQRRREAEPDVLPFSSPVQGEGFSRSGDE